MANAIIAGVTNATMDDVSAIDTTVSASTKRTAESGSIGDFIGKRRKGNANNGADAP